MKLENIDEKKTIRALMAEHYHSISEIHPDEMKNRFPLSAYGIKKGSAQYKKQFPMEFKRYFFTCLHNMDTDQAGNLKRAKSVRPGFFLSNGTDNAIKNSVTQ